MVTAEARKAIEDFEYMRNLAELKALSKVSLARPLTKSEYDRMMQLKWVVMGQ